jgi:single-stranded DNA-specific DHH superfamily exonuclease
VPEDTVDKNLAGLIANQIANKYARPTLILRITKDEEGNTLYAGSGRNYSNSKLDNFREFCLDTGYVNFA